MKNKKCHNITNEKKSFTFFHEVFFINLFYVLYLSCNGAKP